MSSMREVVTMPYVAVAQAPRPDGPPQGQWTYDEIIPQ